MATIPVCWLPLELSSYESSEASVIVDKFAQERVFQNSFQKQRRNSW
jgi:hypothetical protein